MTIIEGFFIEHWKARLKIGTHLASNRESRLGETLSVLLYTEPLVSLKTVECC